MATYKFHVNEPNEIGKRKDRISSKELRMAKDDLNEGGMIKLKDLIEGRVDITVYSTRKEFDRGGMPMQARVRKERDGRYYATIGNRYDKYFKNGKELKKWLKKGGYELAGYDKEYI